MNVAKGSRSYLRDQEDEGSARASFAELFYDLVYVFALIQLAAYIVENLSPEGLVRGALLLLAIWWLWINTAWAMNRLDPERALVRLLLFGMMAAGLMLSVALPLAFDSRGLVVALAYVAMQAGRTLFLVWAHHRAGAHAQRATFSRSAVWFAASGLLWITGGFVDGDARVLFWASALALDFLAPWTGFRVPGLGASSARDWDVEGEHLAERCGLFIILALGESILVMGSRIDALDLGAIDLAAFAVALAGSLVMWWVYFDSGLSRGMRAFERTEEPGRLARFAYTYLHLPIVAGIVVVAVSDKLLLAHPEDAPEGAEALVILGGPALFLLGNLFFKNALGRRWPLSHAVGLVLLALPLPILGICSIFWLTAWTVAVMVVVAVLERWFLRSRDGARAGVV